MKTLLAAAAAWLFLMHPPDAVAEKPTGPAAALESKLCGTWKGEGPCMGGLTLHADRTYERKWQGPSGNNSAGTWELRWDALPPTLILTCKTSDDSAYIGEKVMKLVQLDDKALAFKYPSSESPTHFARVTE
jgi:hypothetical protein